MKLLKPLMIAAALLFGTVALAGPKHHHKGARNPLMRALHHLDLTQQQRQQVRQIMKSSKDDRKNLRKQLAAGKSKMETLLDTDKQDKAAIESLASEQAQLLKQLMLYKAGLFSQVRVVLNEEQRSKLSKMRLKRQKIRGIMLEEI